MDWPLGEAKNKFSEVFEKALRDGPQRIVRRGKDKAVLISEADYRRITHRKRKKMDFIQYLLSAPRVKEFEAPRDKAPVRDPDL